MTDTPRTDKVVYPINGVDIVWPEFARELERELNAANQRIKQLEQLGDVLAKIADENPYHINDVTRWLKIREAKP